MRDNPEGGELDPADNVRRRCKTNSHSILSCIGKSTKEGCDHGSEVEPVHSGRDREGPVTLKPKAEERIVRKIPSPRSIVGMPYLCND